MLMFTNGELVLSSLHVVDDGVSEATIKAHVTAILRKMNVGNRTQAVVAVQRLRISSPSLLEQGSGDVAPR